MPCGISLVRRFIIYIGLILLVIIGVVILYMLVLKERDSPEGMTEFKKGNVHVMVLYSRPSKRGRVIFGELVPYGKVWRTGANEATLFQTNHDLTIKDKALKKGHYSLWTIPGENSWTIIFNTQTGQWGINSEGEANRNPANDALTVEVPKLDSLQPLEQFTITLQESGEELEMLLMWDRVLVSVPISY